MRCPVKNLIVTLEKKLYDSVTFESGQKLFIDPSWHPEEFAMMEATVIGVPDKVGGDESYKGFRIDMRPGDKVLMSYAVVFAYKDQPDNDTPIYMNLFMVGNKEYWKCPLGHVFAYIREGEMNMVNGWVMCDIIEEENPDYSPFIIRPDNQKMTKRRDKMIIRHIGPGLAHEPKLSLQPGDTIYADGHYVQEYKIDQDEFYILRQSRILSQVS